MPTNGTGVYHREYDQPALGLRLQIYDLLMDWTGKQDFGYDHLRKLLGHDGRYSTPGDKPTDLDIMQALAGPHGYAVYKMLLIKRGIKPL